MLSVIHCMDITAVSMWFLGEQHKHDLETGRTSIFNLSILVFTYVFNHK